MDPFTHLMTGACLARAGFNRKAAYATAAMTIAAELPDIDTVWSLGGPIAAFQHHRGWTHTLLGVPLEAAAVVAVAWLLHRRKTKSPQTKAPPRWGLLFAFVAVALLSHLALDWTNNYGLRPFFPFNSRWYVGSLVFIIEPVMFVLLLAALLAPALFGLIGGEVGARRDPFRGRGWAIVALLGIAALWGDRALEQHKALQLLNQQDLGSQVTRIGLNPYPINPFRWQAVIETSVSYQLATVDTWSGIVTTQPGDVFYKPQTTPAITAAKQSRLGHVYLDWSQYPLVNELPRSPDLQDAQERNLTKVIFRDLRFMYDVPFLSGRERSPLSGTATVDGQGNVIEIELNGKAQR